MNKWADYTVISSDKDPDNLQDFLIETTSDGGNPIAVHSYHFSPSPAGNLNKDDFAEYVGKKFVNFVLPPSEIEDAERPFRIATRREPMKALTDNDGKFGEIILYLLMEGEFDMPTISHKISNKQSFAHEQKGSDGLFYGEYKGEEFLGLGEAKFHDKNWKNGLRVAIKDVEKYHDKNPQRSLEEDLNIASATLHQEEFKGDHARRLQEIFDEGKSVAKILHPIFVGYKRDDLHEIQKSSGSISETNYELKRIIEDEDKLEHTKEKVEEFGSEIQKHVLLFMFLPVENTTEFKKNLLTSIYTGATDPSDETELIEMVKSDG
jgi:hypothetical protein